MEYLPTFGIIWVILRVNVGRYSIHEHLGFISSVAPKTAPKTWKGMECDLGTAEIGSRSGQMCGPWRTFFLGGLVAANAPCMVDICAATSNQHRHTVFGTHVAYSHMFTSFATLFQEGDWTGPKPWAFDHPNLCLAGNPS